jgi:muconolactone delta-isomerase
MIYLIDAQIDYNLIGDRLQDLLEQEWKVSSELYASGRMLAIWRKANAKGVIAVWDMPDHEAVSNQIRAMPLYPYMSEVEVTPLVAHPRYPQFCKAPEPSK